HRHRPRHHRRARPHRTAVRALAPAAGGIAVMREHPILRFYLAHERAILVLAAALAVLLFWEGLGRGWWADLLSPLLGRSAEALRRTELRLVIGARSFAASDWFVFRSIVAPSAAPFLLAGLRLGIGRGMIGIVVGELYGAAKGVGFMINRAGALFETDVVFVGIFAIVAAGLALTEIVRRVEIAVGAWRAPIEGA